MGRRSTVTIIYFLWIIPFLLLAAINLLIVSPVFRPVINIPIQISGCKEFEFLIESYWIGVTFFLIVRGIAIVYTHGYEDYDDEEYYQINKIVSMCIRICGVAYCTVSAIILIDKKGVCSKTVYFNLTIIDTLLLPVLMLFDYAIYV